MKRIELFVPGRLCLFGEHSDWAGKYNEQNFDILPGKAIVTGINLGIRATAEKSDRLVIESIDEKKNKVTIESDMNSKELKEKALQEDFFSYCCGVAAYVNENYHVGGVHIVVTEVTLPIKKGLSSSAAICVLVAKAFNELYELGMSTKGIMRIAYQGERLTKSRCGRLDQACAYGEVPVLMDFEGDEIQVEKLSVGKSLYWVIVDLCAGKDTKKILTALNRSYPFAQTELDRNVQFALGEANYDIINRAIGYISDGDDVQLGRLMNEAQSLFDSHVSPACPEELTAPVLHGVLKNKEIAQWIWGGKGVGSHGDGTAQFLARDKKSQKKIVDYVEKVLNMKAYPFEIKAGGKVRKAIIPIAGWGTRMYPETYFIKKAFLPIVDENMVVKPVLLCMLEELDQAGIEEIILVVGEDELIDFKRLFGDIDKSHVVYNDYDLKRLSQKISFVTQSERLGLGHAVYQAKNLIKNEPVMLLLGDFIYKSNLETNCASQTIAAYHKSGGKTIVSIKAVELDVVKNYGIITGEYDKTRDYILHATDMIEKPSQEYARENMMVTDSKGKSTCFATFGQYVLTSEVFDFLGKQIDEYKQQNIKKEIDLTDALRHLIERGKLDAVLVDGISYDVGTPGIYLNTIKEYSRQL